MVVTIVHIIIIIIIIVILFPVHPASLFTITVSHFVVRVDHAAVSYLRFSFR